MIKNKIRVIQILSLDIAVGACAGSLLVAHYLRVTLPGSYLLALGLSVWLIYTADHLSDAYRVKHTAHSARHRYHQQHFHTLSFAFALGLLLNIALVFRLSPKTALWGWALSLLVVLYFLMNQYLPFSKYFYKEFLVAGLYTLGVFLPPVSLYHQSLPSGFWLVFIQFGLIALSNLLLFALYEADVDQKDGHPSFVRRVGMPRAKNCIMVILGGLLVSVLGGLLAAPAHARLREVELIFLLMGVTLCWVAAFPSFFRQQERYRTVGDAVFLFPLFIFIG